MSCSLQILKAFTIIWDILYALFGICMITIGTYIFLKFEYFRITAFATFGCGIAVLFIANFGLISAFREKNRLLKLFAGIVILAALGEILLVVFFWIFQNSLLIDIDQTFDKLWRDQPTPIKPGNASQIAGVELWLNCCGNIGPEDYILPPYSCYNNNDKLNLEGCRQKFIDYIADNWILFNGFTIGIIVVEILCIAFSWLLANSILNRWRRSKYYPK